MTLHLTRMARWAQRWRAWRWDRAVARYRREREATAAVQASEEHPAGWPEGISMMAFNGAVVVFFDDERHPTLSGLSSARRPVVPEDLPGPLVIVPDPGMVLFDEQGDPVLPDPSVDPLSEPDGLSSTFLETPDERS